MYPRSVALVDDDQEFREFLGQYLQELGIEVSCFGSSGELLASPRAFLFDFYVVDLAMPGIDGLALIALLRRRTGAAVLVVSGRMEANVFESVVNAGADMYLAKPVRFDQVALAIRALFRRTTLAIEQASMWRLDSPGRRLIAPDGAVVDLGDSDLAILECFAAAPGQILTREALRKSVGYSEGGESDNALTATIYRLRRRIERATPTVVPLQAQSRVGYLFKANLVRA